MRQRGSSHAALLMGLVVLAVVFAGGYYVYQTNRTAMQSQQQEQQVRQAEDAAEAKKQTETLNIARTDKDQIVQQLTTYCKNQYKDFWEGTYNKSIDPNSITAGYDESVKDPFVIDATHARISAAKCDTDQLTDLQKFAPFTLYFSKASGAWKATERYQTTPPCKDFDGGSWPASVIATCNDNGTERAPV